MSKWTIGKRNSRAEIMKRKTIQVRMCDLKINLSTQLISTHTTKHLKINSKDGFRDYLLKAIILLIASRFRRSLFKVGQHLKW